jgi:hypothetical protein
MVGSNLCGSWEIPETSNLSELDRSIQQFMRFGGNALLEAMFLFLAERDVRATRLGLWRLRTELLELIPSNSIRKMLTKGKTGHLDLF